MVRVIFKGLLLISIAGWSVAGEKELVDLLESKDFICGLQKGNSEISFCKKTIDSGLVEYYFSEDIVNIVASKTIDIKNKYNRKEILNSLKEYCGYAFDSTLGDSGAKTFKEMLQYNIDQDSEKPAAYSAIVHVPPKYESKMVTVATAEQKGKFDTDISVFCFIYPSPVLY